MPYGSSQTLDYFFEVRNGRSTGEKNYREGTIPYISSGDATNSIISLKDDDSAEIFETGGITVTAFGTAALQPWPFLARGNGGSSVRVLLPKYRMTISHLVWFAAQINMQRWRFFYARMAIRSRIRRLRVTAPPADFDGFDCDILERIEQFKNMIVAFSEPQAR